MAPTYVRTRDDRRRDTGVRAPSTEGATTSAATSVYPRCLTVASAGVGGVRSYGPAARVVRTQKMQAASA